MNTDIFIQKIIEIIPLLERLAHKKAKVTEDAEDLVQDVLMHLWLNREQWLANEDGKPLAVHILECRAINLYHKTKIMEPLDDRTFILHERNPYEFIEAKDLSRYILKLMEQLPPQQQLTMRLRDILELELNDIALITDTTLRATRMNLSRARGKIKSIVNHERMC